MGRRFATLVCALAATSIAALLPLGCSSKSNLSCGPGTVQQAKECVPIVVDAGGRDAALDADGDARAALPPSFGGVTSVAPVSATALLATWNPGVDPNDTSAPIAYRIYAAPQGQTLAYVQPVAYALPGSQSAVIGGLSPGMYTVGVRAVNGAGVEDTNTVTLSGSPTSDTTAPTFAGLTAAAAGGSGAVTLSWAPAMDDESPTAAISYLVFTSTTQGGEDFTNPVLVTPPGATSATVGHLAGSSQLRFFVVLARDAAGNVSTVASSQELASTPGPDTQAPQFAGCTGAANVNSVTVAVSWAPAVDDVTLPQNIKYAVLASTVAGDLSKFSSVATSVGQTELVIPNLSPSTRYYFVCRAIDEAGNEDLNAVQVAATTGANAVPPVFVADVTIAPSATDPFGATLSWDQPATDDTTATSAIVYDVYESTARGMEKVTSMPTFSSAMGATSVTLSGLTPNSTLFFVVCARDRDGNHTCAGSPGDGGSEEVSLQTPVSFAQNVAPIFTDNCGVVGCHVPGNPTGGLVLAQGFAYASIVGVTAREASSLVLKPDASPPPPMTVQPTTLADGGTIYVLDYVSPGDFADSFIYIKTNQAALAALGGSFSGQFGSQMPAPATGGSLTQADLDAIQNWIEAGAPNN